MYRGVVLSACTMYKVPTHSTRARLLQQDENGKLCEQLSGYKGRDTVMQFGVALPTHTTRYRENPVRHMLAEAAQAAESLGYASIWVNDHIIVPQSQAAWGDIIEPLITLAFLIPLVPRIHLGTATLVLPQRNALIVAKQAAALDVLSEGRFILGIGVGWLEEEFHFLNADFHRRGAITDEAIEVMRTVWREPVASFHGQFYDVAEALCAPKPARGGPPLWVAGNSPAAIQRAARGGDAWHPFWLGLDDFQAKVAMLRALCVDRQLPTIALNLAFRIAGDGRSARAGVAATAEQVTAVLAQYRQAGLDHVICEFEASDGNDLLRQMQVMAEEVAPALSASP